MPWFISVYQVEITQGSNRITEEFTVLAPTEPWIYYSPRAEGYILAGFTPHEEVRVVLYEGAQAVGVAPLTLDWKRGLAPFS
ncbi:MAG: hypothetical protein R2932_46525 [Caldilineaceae bacterium]